MNRRTFLSMLAAIPFVRRFVPAEDFAPDGIPGLRPTGPITISGYWDRSPAGSPVYDEIVAMLKTLESRRNYPEWTIELLPEDFEWDEIEPKKEE